MIVPAFKKDLQKDHNFWSMNESLRKYWVLPLIILNCHKIAKQFFEHKKGAQRREQLLNTCMLDNEVYSKRNNICRQ